MKSKILHTLALTGSLIAGVAAASPVGAVVVLSNGGANFQAQGPSYYWRRDADAGFCSSRYGTWCQPRYAQWTYTSNGFVSENSGRWTVPVQYQTEIPSRVYAFIPSRNATAYAQYYVNYGKVATSTVYVDQMRLSNAWAPLSSSSLSWVASVDLGDSNPGFNSTTRKVSFDEIKIEN